MNAQKPTVMCQGCGRSVRRDASDALSESCPFCGATLNRNLTIEDVIPEDERYRLTEGTRDHDDQPYAVLGKKPPPPCPSCKEPLPDDVEKCPKCDFDRAAGRRVAKTYPPFDKTWEAGISFQWRLIAFFIAQVINHVICFALFEAVQDIGTTLGALLYLTSLQAFLLGTFDRVRVVRTRKGNVTITRTWRAFFVPLPTKTLTWRGLEAVGVRRDDVGCFAWLIMFQLLTCGIIPGIIWWWYAIRTDRAAAVLLKDQGATVHVLYSGTDADKAEEIAKTVGELTGLPYVPVC
jgi:hypothetical protein